MRFGTKPIFWFGSSKNSASNQGDNFVDHEWILDLFGGFKRSRRALSYPPKDIKIHLGITKWQHSKVGDFFKIASSKLENYSMDFFNQIQRICRLFLRWTPAHLESKCLPTLRFSGQIPLIHVFAWFPTVPKWIAQPILQVSRRNINACWMNETFRRSHFTRRSHNTRS